MFRCPPRLVVLTRFADLGEQAFAKLLVFHQAAEIQQRRGIRHALAPQVDPCEGRSAALSSSVSSHASSARLDQCCTKYMTRSRGVISVALTSRDPDCTAQSKHQRAISVSRTIERLICTRPSAIRSFFLLRCSAGVRVESPF